MHCWCALTISPGSNVPTFVAPIPLHHHFFLFTTNLSDPESPMLLVVCWWMPCWTHKNLHRNRFSCSAVSANVELLLHQQFFFFSSSFIFSLMNLFFFFDSLIAFLNSTDHSSFTRLWSLIFCFGFMIPHQLLNFVAMEPVCSCVGLSDEIVVLYFVRFLSCVCCVAGMCEHGMVFESIWILKTNSPPAHQNIEQPIKMLPCVRISPLEHVFMTWFFSCF